MRRVLSSLSGIVFLFSLWVAPCAVRAGESAAIPLFWDIRRRVEKPDTSQIRQIRFLTEDDFPPFHFTGPDGALMGFEVDLARALCDQLKVTCSIQSRRWDGLGDALLRNQGDAIIAAMRISPEARSSFAFTGAYFRFPARFVTRRDNAGAVLDPRALEGKRVAVADRSAHRAYLADFFPGVPLEGVADAAAALDAVRRGEVHAAFVDGVSAALWLNGEASAGCCAFLGGPYTDMRYFGEGSGIALRRDNPRLREALDWALARVAADGTFATLYLKYFPVSPY